MRIRHLEVFTAVYTIGTVSGAARFLNITQPTASKVLMNAEDVLGYKLFSRIDGKLIPTSEADILFKKASAINKQLLELKNLSQNLKRGGTSKIKIACIPAIGMEFLPKAITEYHNKYPELKFEIQLHQTPDLIDSLHESEKDVGFIFDGVDTPGITQLKLCTGQYVCVCQPNVFENQDTVTLNDIATHKNIISIENSGPLGALLNTLLGDAITDPQEPSIVAQTYLMARNLVAMGSGIAIMDEFSAKTSLYGSVAIKPFDPPLKFDVSAIYLDQNVPSVAAKQFVDFFGEFLTKEMA